VLALPEDVLSERAEVADLPAQRRFVPAAGSMDVEAVREALMDAKRPLCILGGPG